MIEHQGDSASEEQETHSVLVTTFPDVLARGGLASYICVKGWERGSGREVKA